MVGGSCRTLLKSVRTHPCSLTPVTLTNFLPLMASLSAADETLASAMGGASLDATKPKTPTKAAAPAKTSAVVHDLDQGMGQDVYDAASIDLTQFYISTAINYANGAAHIGHAYEAITSDIIARYHRVFGRDVFYLTGSDEHGQKVAAAAAKEGVQPIDVCNKYVGGFQKLNALSQISNDDYIRTTSERHKVNAQALWRRCAANGDIYLDTYEGWYNVREETFVTENEAKMNDYCDPNDGKPLTKVKEESYFFRMSKYQDALVKHFEENIEFVQPESRRNEMLSRLRNDKLRDLSVSRTTFDWGIPVPDDPSGKHVMYVWFDALSNYTSGVDALVEGSARAKYWPANVHIIGKDILWFHSVIWPTMLMSAGLPLPKTIFAHGFVNAEDGRKMSKTWGNTINPFDCMATIPADSFRYYLVRETPYGNDMSFSMDGMKLTHNADLADSLGNLFSRASVLCKKYCDGVVPDCPSEGAFDVRSTLAAAETHMLNFELNRMVETFIGAVHVVNKYLADREPWKMKDDPDLRNTVVRTSLEACYYFAHFFHAMCPKATESMFAQLSTKRKTLLELSLGFNNLVPGTPIIQGTAGTGLFPKLLTSADEKAAAAKKMAAAKSAKKASKGGKKEQSDPNQSVFTQTDIRVGRITKAWEHAGSDKLFCEEIDVGDEKPRQIASGLRAHYKVEDLENRLVLVVCNLKAAKLAGFTSEGMVLCASDSESGKTEFVDPPAGSKVGENVKIEGLTGAPVGPNQMKKRKVWHQVEPGLKSNDDRVACWEGKSITTSAGKCTVASITNGQIK